MSKKKKFALLEEDSTENLSEELLTINITRSPSYDNADKLDSEQLGKRSQKKCKRCREYYYEEENQNIVCRSHPGVFTEPSLTKGTQIGWSCCRPKNLMKLPVWKDLYKEGAYVKTSPGCFTTDKHIEDVAYSDRVMKFPVYNENVVAPKKEPEGRVVEKRDGPIVHKVLAGDTLTGLSLKYNITTDSIKRVNRINSPQIFHYKELIIPHSNDQQVIDAIIKENQQKAAEASERVLKKGQMVVIFRNDTKCTPEEAKFYLEQSDYNMEEALKEWRQDEEHLKNKKN